MIYLTGSLPANPTLFAEVRDDPNIGVLLTPRNWYPTKPLDGWPIAADNGCFGQHWDPIEWQEWISEFERPVMFATVPDVVSDWTATRRRWDVYRSDIPDTMPAAYVLQDDQPIDVIPWDELDWLFIGGSTEYKIGHGARTCAIEAQQRSKRVHMGRVNSMRRASLAARWGCDSVDGTYLAFGPDVNVPKLLRFMRIANRVGAFPTLF